MGMAQWYQQSARLPDPQFRLDNRLGAKKSREESADKALKALVFTGESIYPPANVEYSTTHDRVDHICCGRQMRVGVKTNSY